MNNENRARGILKTLVNSKSGRLATSALIGITVLAGCDNGTKNAPTPSFPTPDKPTPTATATLTEQPKKLTAVSTPTQKAELSPTKTPNLARKPGKTLYPGDLYVAKKGDYVVGDVNVNGEDKFDKGSGSDKTGLIEKLNEGDKVKAPSRAYVQPTSSAAQQEKFIAEEVQKMKQGESQDFRTDIFLSTDMPQPSIATDSASASEPSSIEQPSRIDSAHLLKDGSLNTGDLKNWIAVGDVRIDGEIMHDNDSETAHIITGNSRGAFIEAPNGTGADVVFNLNESEREDLINRIKAENQGKTVIVLEYGKDHIQLQSTATIITTGSTTTAIESMPVISQSPIYFQPNRTHIALPGDVISGDILVNGKREHDHNDKTVLIMTFKGGEKVDFPFGGTIYPTNSGEEIIRAVAKITQEKKAESENIVVNSVLYGQENPQRPTPAEGREFFTESLANSMDNVVSIKKDLLDKYGGVAVVFEDNIIVSGLLGNSKQYVTVFSGNVPEWENVATFAPNSKEKYIKVVVVKSEDDLQLIVDKIIESRKKNGDQNVKRKDINFSYKPGIGLVRNETES